MFKSAVVKLTAWYVAVLVLVCFVFSIPLYNVASARLRRGAELQTDIVRRLPDPFQSGQFIPQIEQQREKQLAEDRRELFISFVIIDSTITLIGGFAGYWFARHTLQPIEDAHEAQAKFTANASHELRTPLAVMQTEIEVALRNKKLSSGEAKEALKSNLEEVERLRQLSDQLLGLTRAEAPLKLKKVTVSRLVLDETIKLSKRHGQDIAVSVEDKLTANVDPVLYTQVLGILVDNAVTYGGAKPDISVGLKRVTDHLLLTVSDKGPGISLVEQEKIFERFYRGAQATILKSSGHGLGLALAKDIVTRHGGSISVQSAKAKGATFTVAIPVNA